MRELLAELNAAIERSVPCAYCAVVETRGSTPQKAGASMLIYSDGRQSGTLGGGCVEAEVKLRALHALQNGDKPEVFTFTLDDTYGWDDGLICGGRMMILAQPFLANGSHRSDARHYFQELLALTDAGVGFTQAVALQATNGVQAGDSYLFVDKGTLVGQIANQPPPDAMVSQLQTASDRVRVWTKDGVAFLHVPARITAFLVGGGHVAHAVAQLAAQVDFNICVLDDREHFASRARFPMASRLLVGDIASTLRELAPTLTASTYALVITRGHRHDEEALYHLAESACGYVGMIGSKRKIKLIYDDLLAQGIRREALERVHAPLGLSIGSKTVSEIAVSIVAELIAHRNLGPAAHPRPPIGSSEP
jgi:xanthine dehydrogenase accessory factor